MINETTSFFYGLTFAISELKLTLVNHDLGDLPAAI
jgi:hypothetical protein